MSKLVKKVFCLLLVLLVVLPASNKIYASPSDKIYSILERGSKNSEITNPLLLKALGKDSKKRVKLITDKNELKNELKNETKIGTKKVINDNSYILGLDESVNSFEEIGKLHSVIEMDITPQEIAKYIDVKYVKKIYKYIERKIMIGELSNDKETIKEFIF